MSVIIGLSLICKRLASVYPLEQTQLQHAWWILEIVTGMTRLQLLCQNNFDIIALQTKIDDIITQHVENHKPLAYIIGSVSFCGSLIQVEPPLLIPRMETEEWIDRLIAQLKNVQKESEIEPFSILDLCAGSGCIAIALAAAFPTAHITALDIEPRAIELIKNNIHHNGGNIVPIQSDLFDALERKPQFDIIISNPPYITPAEYQTLDRSVKEWEDPKALFTLDEGLAIIKKIVVQAPHYIRPHGVLKKYKIPQLIIEIGHAQGNIVQTMMNSAGYSDVHIQKDFAEKDRTVMGRIDYEQSQKISTNVQRGAL